MGWDKFVEKNEAGDVMLNPGPANITLRKCLRFQLMTSKF